MFTVLTSRIKSAFDSCWHSLLPRQSQSGWLCPLFRYLVDSDQPCDFYDATAYRLMQQLFPAAEATRA
jgi:hypothetical protein